MLMLSSLKSPLRVALLASALGLAFPAIGSAQEYDRYGNPVASNAPDEITIYAPRHRHAARGDLGGPIEDVSLSEGVRYDDLDLTTDWGIRKLHERISATAQALCHRLDVTHPIAVSDSPPCYRTAMEEAAPLAIAAIDRQNARAQNAPCDDRYNRDDDGDDDDNY